MICFGNVKAQPLPFFLRGFRVFTAIEFHANELYLIGANLLAVIVDINVGKVVGILKERAQNTAVFAGYCATGSLAANSDSQSIRLMQNTMCGISSPL